MLERRLNAKQKIKEREKGEAAAEAVPATTVTAAMDVDVAVQMVRIKKSSSLLPLAFVQDVHTQSIQAPAFAAWVTTSVLGTTWCTKDAAERRSPMSKSGLLMMP